MAHIQDGDVHGVATELHVLIMPASEGGYVAQGIEIDYTATGVTEEDVREHFAKGFIATIRSYLHRRRELKGLFKTKTPAHFVEAYYASKDRPVFRCAIGQSLPEAEARAMPNILMFIQAVDQAAA